MKITDQEVARIAHLARLRFSPDECAAMTVQLNSILECFESLAEAETEGVEPLCMHVARGAHTLRPDDAQPCLAVRSVFRNAPDSADNLFKVPKIIEG